MPSNLDQSLCPVEPNAMLWNLNTENLGSRCVVLPSKSMPSALLPSILWIETVVYFVGSPRLLLIIITKRYRLILFSCLDNAVFRLLNSWLSSLVIWQKNEVSLRPIRGKRLQPEIQSNLVPYSLFLFYNLSSCSLVWIHFCFPMNCMSVTVAASFFFFFFRLE